jgi:anti-anti-sigma factor
VPFTPHLPSAVPDLRPEPRAFGVVTGADGTELIRICRYREPASAGDRALLVVDVSGDVDLDTAPLLDAALTGAITENRHVCCDLTRVTFLSAAGARTIMAAMRSADEAGCVFTVRGVHGIATRVFRITGLDTALAART